MNNEEIPIEESQHARTMIGLGLTLILLLGYAVYSNTVDTEYYRFETTNESRVELDKI